MVRNATAWNNYYVRGWPAYIGHVTLWTLPGKEDSDEPDEDRFSVEGPIYLLPGRKDRVLKVNDDIWPLTCYLRGYQLPNVCRIADLEPGSLVYVTGLIDKRIIPSDFQYDDPKWSKLPGAFMPQEIWIDHSAGHISPHIAICESSQPLDQIIGINNV